jgi:hypothetical protein
MVTCNIDAHSLSSKVDVYRLQYMCKPRERGIRFQVSSSTLIKLFLAIGNCSFFHVDIDNPKIVSGHDKSTAEFKNNMCTFCVEIRFKTCSRVEEYT